MTHNVVLFQYEACPFCRRVTRFMKQHNIELPQRDTRAEPQARVDLITAGGKSQVPALMIDGQVLYESSAIIEWMQKNLVDRTAINAA